MYYIISGSYNSIEHNGEHKPCLAACEGQTYQVTQSSSTFPVPSTFSLTPEFCFVVRKIKLACQDQRNVTLEMVYPNICLLIDVVLNYKACGYKFIPEKIIEWKSDEIQNCSELILKNTTENIVKANIYIKDPFAAKYLIESTASR